MFTLVTDKCPFYRVKRGQSEKEIEDVLLFPVCGKAFAGAVLFTEDRYEIYTVKPCETYRSIAGKVGISEEELKKINSDRPLYPTQKLFVPCR